MGNSSARTIAPVSVVVPVFNGEAFVAEALQSILGQSRPPSQVIVVDDGSTDATPTVLASFSDAIEIVRQENRGSSAAMNAGVARATEPFLAFCDADDRWTARKLEVQFDHLELRPDLDAVFAHAREFFDAEHMTRAPTALRSPFENAPAWLAGTALVRKASFDRVGAFDTTFAACEFLDWIARARDADLRVEMIFDVLLERRIHGANLTADTGYGRALAETLQAVVSRRRADQ